MQTITKGECKHAKEKNQSAGDSCEMSGLLLWNPGRSEKMSDQKMLVMDLPIRV